MAAPVGRAIIALQKYPQHIQPGRDTGFTLYAKIDPQKTAPKEAAVSTHRNIMQAGKIRPVAAEQAQLLHNIKNTECGTLLRKIDIFANTQNVSYPVLNAALDISSLLDFYKTVKKQTGADAECIKLNDIILFAVSKTLTAYPDINAHFVDNNIDNISDVNLAFDCDTDNGLMLPVVFGANKLSLLTLAKTVRRLSDEAKSFRISPENLTGGSFTVLNFGEYGVNFVPVVMPPQIGILSVNTIETKVREKDGELAAYPSLSLSMSFNSSAVDGMLAAKFLKALCGNLENLAMLIIQ